MNNRDFEILKEESINNIPIEEVASLVMDNFQTYKGRITATCPSPSHLDKNFGNVSFKYNRVRCFSCNQSWNNINLVMIKNNLKYLDAIKFLYNHFPSYYSIIPDFNDINIIEDNWKGLSNKEYKKLGMSTSYIINGITINVRELYLTNSTLHDQILKKCVDKKIKEVENFYNYIKTTDKFNKSIETDFKVFKQSILLGLKKGLYDKSCVSHISSR